MAFRAYLVEPRRPSDKVMRLLRQVAGAAGFTVESAGGAVVLATPRGGATVHASGEVEGDEAARIAASKLLLACAAASAMKRFMEKVRVRYWGSAPHVEASAVGSARNASLEAAAAGARVLEVTGSSDQLVMLLASGLESEGFSVRELRLEVKRKAPSAAT